MAILLGSGSKSYPVDILSKSILLEFGSFFHLISSSHSRLLQIPGIGEASASKLRALNLLVSKVLEEKRKWNVRPKRFPEVLKFLYKELLLKIVGLNRENFFLICFDQNLELTLKTPFAKGVFDRVEFSKRELMQMLLSHDCFYLIIAHNHPLGDLEASSDDLKMFQILNSFLHDYGVQLLDSWILTCEGVYSTMFERRIEEDLSQKKNLYQFLIEE